MEYIDVTPIKEAVAQALANGDSLSAICRRIGWDIPEPDTSRLKRRVGLMEYRCHKKIKINKKISRENAELIANSINIDYRDIGL